MTISAKPVGKRAANVGALRAHLSRNATQERLLQDDWHVDDDGGITARLARLGGGNFGCHDILRAMGGCAQKGTLLPHSPPPPYSWLSMTTACFAGGQRRIPGPPAPVDSDQLVGTCHLAHCTAQSIK